MTSDTESSHSAEDWFKIGLDRGRAGDHQGAIEAYQEAVEQDPNHFKAYMNMGLRYGKLLMNVKALDSFKKAIDIKPDDPIAHYSLALTANLCGLTDDSIKHYKEAVRIKPTYAEAYSNLATVYYQFKQGKDAIENLLIAQKLFDEQGNRQMVATAQSLLQDLYNEFNMKREDFPEG
ncbi:MAG: tetratricopeptide repeat protein [Candidatus Nitronauta litoralis]|uniref:Tetratricopeptide repeat protein n=1 Tax=Candidatus Nitronauta litoralis TaxID=2705533 RepID=A0A7T0BXD2_9BACT|nr:MAG: tetratricopeptide repeat protein [Candidatus Nitronauta litoralis]